MGYAQRPHTDTLAHTQTHTHTEGDTLAQDTPLGRSPTFGSVSPIVNNAGALERRPFSSLCFDCDSLAVAMVFLLL